MLIKKFVYLIVMLFLGIVILEGCSTENNSFINRTYHRTTAKYNGYFNANELIKTSLSAYKESAKEDFYDVLPVELIPGEKEVTGMLPSIDTAVVKCTKVIRNHCMPSMDRPEGKKVEYNTWIDENWNLIGQAYYYRRDYELSIKNFEFVKELFKNDKSTYIARIWIIKNKIALGKIDEARALVLEMDEIIEKQEKEAAATKFNFIEKTKKLFAKKEKNKAMVPPKVTKTLQAEFNFTKASFYIAEEDYPKAIEALEKAIKLSRNKQQKIRAHYILGQLYALNKNPENAKNHFNTVVKSPASPFEMQFNARINRAFLGQDEKVKRELTKLLKDEKNADYRDQLYYALADIALQEKNKPEAINLLHKSTYYSTNNKRQQAVSYERLGTLSYQDKQYVKAQKYYDSCANVMPENYPNGDDIRKKVTKLKKLVESVTIVETQDSLLRIAAMSEKDRENYIKKTIKNIKEDAARKEREEKAKMQAKIAKQLAEEQNNPSSNKWYWNNAKTKADGYSEFKKNWGVRENADDWRRSDKIVLAQADTSSKEKSKFVQTEIVDTLTVEYLSKKLPQSQQEVDSALAKLVAAEYDAGVIYKEQLNEAKLASACFQDILARKHTSNYNLLASFQLYKMNEKDASKSTPHRNYILTNYPNSDYASYLRDPNFFTKQKEQEKKNEEHYVSILEKYRQKNYAEVIASCQQAEANPEETMKSKFLLLRALATAASTEDKKSISPILETLIKSYPGTPEAKKAKELADILEKGYSKYEPVVFKKEFPFAYEEGEPLWIILFLDKNSNSNAAKNKISSFNDETFEKMDITVSSKLYESDQSVIILKSFSQTEGDAYIKSFKGDTKSIKEYAGLPIYMISQDNLKLLFENKNLEIYKDFYQEYFK
jgi:tetratricopeptide (TPR) repeat protein